MAGMLSSTIGRGNILYDGMIQVTITPSLVGASTAAEQTFTVPGLQLNDFLDINCNAAQTAGIGIGNVRVSAVNTMAVEFANSTAGGLTPASGVYNINVIRAEGPIPSTAA
jgi:hypothetical protein